MPENPFFPFSGFEFKSQGPFLNGLWRRMIPSSKVMSKDHTIFKNIDNILKLSGILFEVNSGGQRDPGMNVIFWQPREKDSIPG